MGYEQVELKIVGKLSKHNSPRDGVHEKIWEEFVAYITAAINNGAYRDLWNQLDITIM
jgi:hypothetical protein